MRLLKGSAPDRFCREKFFPTSCSEMVARFLSLFHRYGYIYKPMQGGAWLSANESWRLTDSEILKAIACAHPKYFLGCRSGRATKFAVIDIDAGSCYHNKDDLDRITALLYAAGLPNSTLYRSSESGGWHLYLFFAEPISSKDLRNQLIELLRLHNFRIAKGTLEVFPQPGDQSLGQGLRLPLQPGWAWLNPETLSIREERLGLSPVEALSQFMADYENESNTHHEFHRLKAHVQDLLAHRQQLEGQIRSQRGTIIPFRKSLPVQEGDDANDVLQAFGHVPPGINCQSWTKGRRYYEDGLTGPSQRADAIFCLSHYLFYGDPMRQLHALGYGYEQEREWAIQQIIQAKHNGYSEEITRGRADALEQARRAAYWLPAHKSAGTPHPTRYRAQVPKAWARHNANQKADARRRIHNALKELVNLGTPFTVTALKQQSSCSWDTLYANQDIWRVIYNQQSVVCLAISPPEYNVVVGGGGSETPAPAQPCFEVMPPGRLAARQIVDELKMRAERDAKNRQREAKKLRVQLFDNWKGKVTTLTSQKPSELPVKHLKALVNVLGFYLAMAPTEDDAIELQRYIQSVQSSISAKYAPPGSIQE